MLDATRYFLNFLKDDSMLKIIFTIALLVLAGCDSEPERSGPFTESDFYWDETIEDHKVIIVDTVNLIAQIHPRCYHPDPGSAYLSTSRGTDENPVFFVTCDSDKGSFNVWFDSEGEILPD